MVAPILNIPTVSAQSSYPAVLSDVSQNRVKRESFWVSCASSSASSVHGSVQVYNQSNATPGLESEDGVQVELKPSSKNHSPSLIVSCPSLNIVNALVVPPVRKYLTDVKFDLSAFDVSASNEFLVYAEPEGRLQVLSIQSGRLSPLQTLDGHVSYISKVRFFPLKSSTAPVVLSGGGDLIIRLWNVLDGSNPRSFSGHSAAIVDFAFIGNGRNFLSGSRDGTVKLWECGSGECLYTFSNPEASGTDAVTKLTVTTSLAASEEEANALETSSSASLEFTTHGQMAIIAFESGTVIGLDLHEKKILFSEKGSWTRHDDEEITGLDSSNSIAFVATSKGSLSRFNLKKSTSSPDWILNKQTQSPFSDVAYCPQTHTVIIGSTDGVPLKIINADSDTNKLEIAYLAGFDVAATTGVKSTQEYGNFVAGKSGGILVYA